MKSPAFQFYPTDYMGSQRVKMMTLEEEGAYVNLLCSCWQHGSIPADPQQAARLIGKGCSTVVASVVLAMFTPSEAGRMVHDRLESERRKQAEWREKSAQGGRKSAEIRKGGSTTPEGMVQPLGNSPSPSPSPDSVTVSVSEPDRQASPAKGVQKSAIQVRAEAIFKRRSSTPLSASEAKAWKQARQAIESTPETEFAILEQFYAAPESPAAQLYRRTSLATLLNNWSGEIDKARKWAATRSEFAGLF